VTGLGTYQLLSELPLRWPGRPHPRAVIYQGEKDRTNVRIIEGEALVPTHNVQPSQSSPGMDLEGS